ncbi:MAG: DNA polymerase III subunit delta [Bacteroidales bacterium]|nr:DNA polymerase III subunit delta [Bacteroidales bacterium]
MMFKDIAGSAQIKENLVNMVQNNRLPHALLFSGQEGVGKLALAIALAQYVNCTNRTPYDSCGVCASCSKIQKIAHPDLHFVFPLVKKDNPKIRTSDDCLPLWREQISENPYFNIKSWMNKLDLENQQPGIFVEEASKILEKLNLKTYEADYKTMIIWLPERMHNSVANKILKMLEEPFEKTLIIMVSEAPDKLLPTVLSRMQHIRIPRLGSEEIKNEILKSSSLSEQEALDLAVIADGCLAEIHELINSSENLKGNFELFVRIMRLAYKKDIFGINQWVEEVVSMGREKQKDLLNYMMRLIRENFILNIQEPSITCLTAAERDFSEKFSPFIHKNNVFGMYDETGKAYFHIERNGNAKIVLFDFAVKMILLIKG